MKFVIIHGSYGSPQENWFPWLKKELEKLGQKVIIPQFPCEDWEKVNKTGLKFFPKRQNLTNWIATFEKKVLPKINNDGKICFIGHSLGPVFILHLITKYHLKLDCAYFVAPFLKVINGRWQFYLVNNTFYKIDFNFEKIRRLIPKSYVYCSDNDPYLPKKYSLEFANKMKSELITVKNAGHFNVSYNAKFQKFPLLLENIKRFMKNQLKYRQSFIS